MIPSFKSRQLGLSFIGLLFVFALVGVAAVIALQVVPTVLEYQSVLKAVNKAKDGTTVAEIRTSFDKTASIDNITSIKGADLDVTKADDGRVVVGFAYEREIHLVGPAYLTLKYAGQSQ